MKRMIRNNGLSLVFFLLFLLTLVAQAASGLKEYNEERKDEGRGPVGISAYLCTGHFMEATFENWESEFLQMGLFVILTTGLYQKGSSESKDPDKKEEVDRKPSKKKRNAPWPVRKGEWALSIYQHSLSLSLFLLFIISFVMHWYGSLRDYNEKQILKGLPTEHAFSYLGNSKLWFESFENWQSEFLSVFAIVILSIYLREKNSPQSKPVDAPHYETGE